MKYFLINFQIRYIKFLFYISNGFLEIIRRIFWIREKHTHFQKICIYKIGNIGDIVCSIPAMQKIRKAYPMSHITLVTSPGKRGMPGGKEILGNADWLDEIIIYYSDDLDSIFKTFKWWAALKKK